MKKIISASICSNQLDTTVKNSGGGGGGGIKMIVSEEIAVPYISVVYFNQCLGAAHSERLSKYLLLVFSQDF